jgi:hypothetical protein
MVSADRIPRPRSYGSVDIAPRVATPSRMLKLAHPLGADRSYRASSSRWRAPMSLERRRRWLVSPPASRGSNPLSPLPATSTPAVRLLARLTAQGQGFARCRRCCAEQRRGPRIVSVAALGQLAPVMTAGCGAHLDSRRGQICSIDTLSFMTLPWCESRAALTA